jgi:hypothetical protein
MAVLAFTKTYRLWEFNQPKRVAQLTKEKTLWFDRTPQYYGRKVTPLHIALNALRP